MTKNIYKKTIGLTNLIFAFAIIISLFITIKKAGEGNIIPWSFAIVSGLLSIILALPMLKETFKSKGMAFIILTIIVLLNLLMVLFSILDIVRHGNYFISTIIFIAIPIPTIATLSLMHCKHCLK